MALELEPPSDAVDRLSRMAYVRAPNARSKRGVRWLRALWMLAAEVRWILVRGDSASRRSVVACAGGVLVASVMLWLSLLGMLGYEVRQELTREEERVDALARTWQEVVGQIVIATDRGLVLAKQVIAAGRSPQEAIDDGAQFSGVRPEVVFGMTFVDASGRARAVAKSLPSNPAVGTDFSDYSLFRKFAHSSEPGPAISPTLVEPWAGRPFIAIGRRIDGPGGEFRGLVVATISVEYLSEVLRTLGSEPGMGYAVIGTDGHIRFRQDYGATVQYGAVLPAEHPLYTLVRTDDDYAIGTTAHGVGSGLRIYSLRRLPDLPLVIGVGSSAQRVMIQTARHWMFGVAGVAVGTIMLWVCFLFALHSIVRGSRNRGLLRRALVRSRAGERAKAAFLGNLSHELRTPLTGILGYASFIERLSTEEPVREMGRTVRRSAERLTALLNDSLDAARVEAGVMSVEIGDVPVHEVVLESAALFEPASQAKGLRLTASIDDGVPQTVRGDSARLRQVLHNLLSNALKFTECGDVRVEACVEARQLRLTVADTGCGIPAESLGRIFERFQQANERVSWHHGGTGLGLALARDFMRRMGGEIMAVSEPGRGTTMTVTLPLAG